ncbi:MAG: TrkA family potassium uptake protein [Spirochaetaceae bacterium]|jgi:trk system potassium uptake protein TrkA|nr:TrkA family potassium uptake protein [Spirochaetaceae bacterium]
MKQVAILGLGHFGRSILDELIDLKVAVFIVDKDREIVDLYKDLALHAVIADILSIENLRKILPESTDAVIIDMGSKMEASILAASYCSKLHIKTIIAKAETEAQGEILELVGATKVVFPNREAAKRITPLLLSDTLLSYMPVSAQLSLAELAVPEQLIGKNLMGAELRTKYHLNLISIRNSGSEEFTSCEPSYVFKPGDIGLFSGTDEALNNFNITTSRSSEQHPQNLAERFLKLFRRR